MDPKCAKINSDGASGDVDGITHPQKCSRRVRFAETTSVYVFDRDDDFETPSDSDLDQNEESFSSLMKFSDGNEEEEEESESGFESEYSDSDEDDDDVDGKFINDMDSCWTGSVAVSLASDDEDDFFGPVSANFMTADHLYEMIQSTGLAKDEKGNTLSSPHRRPLNDSILQSDQDLEKSVQAQPRIPCSVVDVQQHPSSENGTQIPQNALGSILPVHLSQLDMKQNNGYLYLKECSQADDDTTDIKASHVKMLGGKLYRSEGSCASPKVNGSASQNDMGDRQSLINLESNDGFKGQINGSIDFQSDARGENIQTNRYMEKTSTDNQSTHLAEKTVQSFSTESSNGEIMQHSPSLQHSSGKRGIDPTVKDDIKGESRILKISRIF